MVLLSGFITLDGLLLLNIDQVQAHLNSLQWPSTSDLESFDVFARETKAIFLIIAFIDTVLAQPMFLRCAESQSHLFELRSILTDEHETRLIHLSHYHGSIQ